MKRKIFIGLLMFYVIIMLLVGLSLPTMASYNLQYNYEGVEDIIVEVTTELEKREISSDSVVVIGFGSEENRNKPMALRAAKIDAARMINSLENEGENLQFQKSWSIEDSEGAIFYTSVYTEVYQPH